MERKVDDQAPDPSMLWLAIGIGVFSVLASFFLAIYSSTDGDTASQEQQAFESATQKADH